MYKNITRPLAPTGEVCILAIAYDGHVRGELSSKYPKELDKFDKLLDILKLEASKIISPAMSKKQRNFANNIFTVGF
jgi:hypothetical protein